MFIKFHLIFNYSQMGLGELYESQLYMMNIILRLVLFLKDALKFHSNSYPLKVFFIKTHHFPTKISFEEMQLRS
jgi:hypothetical protein